MPGRKARKKAPPPVAAEQNAPSPIVEQIDALIARLAEEGSRVPLGEVFSLALQFEEYTRIFRERTVVQATRHVPRAVEEMGRRAAQGDVAAARLLFDVAGLTGHGGRRDGAAAVLTQVNVNVPKLKDVIDIESWQSQED